MTRIWIFSPFDTPIFNKNQNSHSKIRFWTFYQNWVFWPKNWHLSPVCEIKLTLVKSKKNLRPFDRFDRFSSSQFTFVSKFCFEWSQTGEETLSTNSENRGHKAICSICRATFHLSCCYFDIASSRPIETTPIRSLFFKQKKNIQNKFKIDFVWWIGSVWWLSTSHYFRHHLSNHRPKIIHFLGNKKYKVSSHSLVCLTDECLKGD